MADTKSIQTFDLNESHRVRLNCGHCTGGCVNDLTIHVEYHNREGIRGWSWEYRRAQKQEYGYTSREEAIEYGLAFAKAELLCEQRLLKSRLAEVETLLEKIV